MPTTRFLIAEHVNIQVKLHGHFDITYLLILKCNSVKGGIIHEYYECVENFNTAYK